MNILHNPSTSLIYKKSLFFDKNFEISSNGSLIAYSGKYTGRNPDWKHIVFDKLTEKIWWGNINHKINLESFSQGINIAKKFIFDEEKIIYCMDSTINWNPKYSFKIRLYTVNPYHALFFKNMTIPSKKYFKKDTIDLTIYDAGSVNYKKYDDNDNYDKEGLIGFNFSSKKYVILGTEYAGEIKKGLLTYMMYKMPLINALPLHSSANISNTTNEVTIFFGLSGTGKTTLSTEANRKLIGDDEHVWTDDGIFNIEGGCYAKCKDLTQKNEPEIFNAIKFGSVLENVKYDKNNLVDYSDISITSNTRCSYPLEYIDNVLIPATTNNHPSNIILLCCDIFGILPPVAKLNNKQAIYFFLNGYTSKVPGTVQGQDEPEITFSSCFGDAFLVHHPVVYGDLLKQYINKYKCKIWLINTGWIKGDYKDGIRIPLKYSRKIVDCINNGSINDSKYIKYPLFNFEIPIECDNIPLDVLNPNIYWEDKNKLEIYRKNLKILYEQFEKNYIKTCEKNTK
jgi:phosphoenolpyruvate carboxykinase (ATP)